ncbi:MAG: nucleotide exchange factor GrpE [Cyclobacteriaceae bacterium]|jgi:molecular chaperone GrpE|nr:nucleotide exchange factor GrpE [Cyclobacteriaceae bacterium]
MENQVPTEQTVENKAENPEINQTATEKAQAPEAGKGPAEALKKLQDELAEAKDKYVRLYAEFDNFRRRSAKERLELIQTANEKLLRDFLTVADDMDRAEKAFREKSDKDLEGFFLIQNKFKKVLEQNGVKPMGDTRASEFNPDLHEAITQLPAPEESLKGKIVDVVEPGYFLHDKVIRFAKVVVGA